MKRIWLWLREFTLSQQLLAILFVVISLFAAFLFAFLAPQINLFTESEMYRTLHSSQTTLSYYLNQNPGMVPSFKIGDDNSGIVQVIYTPSNNSFIVLGGGTLSKEAQTSIRSNAQVMIDGTLDFQFSDYNEVNESSEQIMYSMTKLVDHRFLISMLPSFYEAEFKQMLLNNIINLNVMVASFLFLVLTLWVATLIHPLNQIKTYITKIKKDEQAYLTVQRHDEIGEVADALRDMNTELQRQNSQKQEMIQNISHDLKTPIATIKSYGESIKDGVYPYGTLEKSIDVIVEHADRLEKKVRSLIALNKMGYLLDDCPPGETLNMNDIVDKVLLSLKVIRPEITFQLETSKDVKFHGDGDPWRIVVENLVDNALRYAASTIKITLHPGELCVINDGKLMTQDRIDKLFKPYEKGTDGQFGLGLSIVYKVVTTYGYSVEAENMQEGVCFRISRELTSKEKRTIQRELKKSDKEKQKERKN